MKIVVGVDPGTTVGLAIFNLEGKALFLGSKKNAGIDWVTTNILDMGDPVIVATDVNPVPKFVRKISSLFSAKLFYPKKDIPVSVKEELTKHISVKDNHQRDSAAAALYALKFYQPLFKKVDVEMRKRGLDVGDEIKSGLVLGKFSNINNGIAYLTSPVSIPRSVKEKRHKIPTEVYKYIEEVKRRYAKLVAENEELRRRLDQLKRANDEYVERVVEQKVAKLKADNEQLRKIIEKMKKSFSLSDFVEVVELENYGRRQLLSHDLKDRVVMIKENKGNLEGLSRTGAKLVIADFTLDIDIPFAKLEDVNLIKVGDKLYIRKRDVDKLISSDSFHLLKKLRKRFYGGKKK